MDKRMTVGEYAREMVARAGMQHVRIETTGDAILTIEGYIEVYGGGEVEVRTIGGVEVFPGFKVGRVVVTPGWNGEPDDADWEHEDTVRTLKEAVRWCLLALAEDRVFGAAEVLTYTVGEVVEE